MNNNTTELTHAFTRATGGLARFDVGDDVRIRGEHGVARTATARARLSLIHSCERLTGLVWRL